MPKQVGHTDLVETYRTPIVGLCCLAGGVDSTGQISLVLRWEVLGLGVPNASRETKETFVGDVHVVIVLILKRAGVSNGKGIGMFGEKEREKFGQLWRKGKLFRRSPGPHPGARGTTELIRMPKRSNPPIHSNSAPFLE